MKKKNIFKDVKKKVSQKKSQLPYFFLLHIMLEVYINEEAMQNIGSTGFFEYKSFT